MGGVPTALSAMPDPAEPNPTQKRMNITAQPTAANTQAEPKKEKGRKSA